MTDNTELKRLAEALLASDDHADFPGWMAASDAFDNATGPAAVLAVIAESERLESERADLWRGKRDVEATRDTKSAVIAELKAEIAGLKTGYEAYEQVNAELKAENEALNSAIEDLDRARIAGFEEYDFTRLKDRRGDKKVFEITIETECGCDIEEGEYTVRITNLLGNWLGSDDFGLVGDAVAEVVADLGLPEEGYTTFIAYETGERQDVFWTKWFEIATVASVLVEPGAAMGNGEQP